MMVSIKKLLRQLTNKPKKLNPEIYSLVEQGNRNALLIYLQYCIETKTTLNYDLLKQGLFTSAKQGNSDSMFDLGHFHLSGSLSFPQDPIAATQWFFKAAEQQHTNAMNQLAYCYLKGWGVEINHSQALYWYEKSAALGSSEAIANTGNLYASGQGVDKDLAKAKSYYLQAAELGNSNAMNNLAYLYFNGLGVEQDETEANNWLQKAQQAKAKEPTPVSLLTI